MNRYALITALVAALFLAGCGDTTVTDLDGKGKLITTKLNGGGTLVTTCNADGVCTKELIQAPAAAPPPAPVAAAMPGFGSFGQPSAPSGVVNAGHRRHDGHHGQVRRAPPKEDPLFNHWESRCGQQLAIRQAENPNVPYRVTGGPGQRSNCNIGSTFREEGAVD